MLICGTTINRQCSRTTATVTCSIGPGGPGGDFRTSAEWPLPGAAAGRPVDLHRLKRSQCRCVLRRRVRRPGIASGRSVLPGYHKIQAFYDPDFGGDYHWYRQDPDGSWSFKLGSGEVDNIDASQQPILDPMNANRDYGPGRHYSESCPVLISRTSRVATVR